MYNKILVPVDMAHTEKAHDMLKAAEKLSGDDGQIVMVNIVLSVPAVAELAVPQEFFQAAEKEAHQTLEKLAADSPMKTTYEVRVGQPASEILTVAEEQDVDLVIVGSHRPGLQDYLLGSTAARVVRHAQCPVLVMR